MCNQRGTICYYLGCFYSCFCKGFFMPQWLLDFFKLLYSQNDFPFNNERIRTSIITALLRTSDRILKERAWDGSLENWSPNNHYYLCPSFFCQNRRRGKMFRTEIVPNEGKGFVILVSNKSQYRRHCRGSRWCSFAKNLVKSAKVT